MPHARTVVRLALTALTTLLPALGAAQSTAPPTLPTCLSGASMSNTALLAVVVNGACTDLSSQLRRTSETLPLWEVRTTATTAAGEVSVQASYDGDPFIAFTFGSILASFDNISFDVFFATPIVGGPYNTASSQLGITLSSGPAGATVAVGAGDPAFLTGIGMVGAVSTNLGVNIGTAPCVASASQTSVCPFAPGLATFAPTAFTSLVAHLSYTHTGLGSAAGLTGRIDLTSTQSTVPEPTPIALTAIGLLATGVAARRRAR